MDEVASGSVEVQVEGAKNGSYLNECTNSVRNKDVPMYLCTRVCMLVYVYANSW